MKEVDFVNNKKKSKFWKITKNIFWLLIVVVLGWVVFHYIMNAYEQKKFSAPGEYVTVDDKKMHVLTKGKGENTIVLFSGLGTAAPSLDFEPLMNELAKKNRVVVVEPFGYGWSDMVDKKRTVENIVEETRTALKKANIEGPYVLMPHSVSGIYSMYYANKYPNEVKSIVGIDPTLPQALEYFSDPAPKMPNFMRYVAPTGLARLAVYINSNNFLPMAKKETYSEENLNMTKAISSWKTSNKSVVDEANELKNNIDKTNTLTFPSQIPVLLFAKKDDKVNEDGKSKLTFYQTQISVNSSNKIITLEGHHYLHWTKYKEMSNSTNEFIEENSNKK